MFSGENGSEQGSAPRQRRFKWPRFWVEHGGNISLSDGGYLLDPLWEATRAGGTQLKTLSELAPFRALALLGEPGMGKSVALETEARRQVEGADGAASVIRVDAIRRAPNGDTFNVITAVIETKGCWNPGLTTAMETQLRDDYLVRLGSPVGIYLVGWFNRAKWDSADGRRDRTPDWDVAEAQRRLDLQAARLSGGFLLRAVVLDCHAP